MQWSETSFKFDLAVPHNKSGFDIVITTSEEYQAITGFGASLTDSAAYLLRELKASNGKSTTLGDCRSDACVA